MRQIFREQSRDSKPSLLTRLRYVLMIAVICGWSVHSARGESPSVRIGDFNGDGKSDALRWRNADKLWVVNLSTGTDFSEVTWSGAWGSDGPISLGDLNGDGKTDVFIWRESDKDWTVNLSTGSGWIQQSWGGSWGSDGPIQVGDLNGDRKTDVFMWREYNQDWTVNLSTGSGWRSQTWRGAWGSDGPINVGDLNGDGKTDVFMWRESNKVWTVNLSTGSGWEQKAWGGMWGSDGPINIGDLNGDGKTDVFMWREEAKRWSVNLSTGTDWKAFSWEGAWGSDGTIKVADLNDDKKIDVAMWRGDVWTVNLSTGSGFQSYSWAGASASSEVFVGDVDNNHKTDLIMLNEQDNAWHVNLSTGIGFVASVWCSGRPCGTDGTPIFVAKNPRGQIIGMYGTSHDGIKRSIGIGRNIYEIPRGLGGTITNLSECVDTCPAGQVQTSELRCEYAHRPTSRSPGTPTMALCKSGDIKVVSISHLQYFDSSGKRLTETVRYIKGSGAATYEIENKDASASVAVLVDKAVLRFNYRGAVSTQTFPYPYRGTISGQQSLAYAFPEISDAQYFASTLPLIFAAVGVQLPPPPTSPGWYQYLGDAVIGIGFGVVAYMLVVEAAPFAAILVGAAAVVGEDVWQSEKLVRDKSWESLFNPLCSGARSLDELENQFHHIPQAMTVFHALGCDK